MSARVLVVGEGLPPEGDPLRAVFSDSSFETELVGAGCSASLEALLRAARAHQPDIILLEGDAAKEDDYNLCKQIKSLDGISDIPLLVFSKGNDVAERIRGLSAGADDVLPPLDRREMRAKLQAQLTRKRHRDRMRAKLIHSMEMAYRDPLTGLSNRRAMDDCLPDMLAEGALAILIADLDRFKRVNDSHGHDMGDEVLVKTARALRENLRQSDLLCRIGGDEFLVGLTGLSSEALWGLAERLRVSIASLRFPFAERITASLGFATSGIATSGFARAKKRETLAHLIKRADGALYRAKDSGGNRVRSAERHKET